ncbi:MAG: hypothetical protein R3D03_10260 [Geminicoccaceae bacterium]
MNGGGGAHPSYLNITGYTTTTATTGNGEAHPNVQPSVAVRMWKRTA